MVARERMPLPIQIGGGMRSLETIEHYVTAGVRFVIIGTMAVRQPEFVDEACRAFPGRILIGLDARDGRVATDGWAEEADLQATDLARRFGRSGGSAFVYSVI